MRGDFETSYNSMRQQDATAKTAILGLLLTRRVTNMLKSAIFKPPQVLNVTFYTPSLALYS